MTRPRRPALILIGHGSSDPEWRVPLDRVFEHVRALAPERPARLCFLEKTEPDFPTAVAELVQDGAQKIRVVALLLSSTGRHFRADIPALIARARTQFPEVQFELDPAAVGTHDRVIRAMAEAATADPMDQ